LSFLLEPFFTHQKPFEIDSDSDDGMESQNEDDQPASGTRDAAEGGEHLSINFALKS
jgi:hypothetical protein